MKLQKSTINGKQYWYVFDGVYINRGYTKQTSASLGPVEKTTTESLNLKMIKFRDKMAKIEAEERTKYWVRQITDPQAFTNKIVEEMEQLRAQLYRAKKDLGSTAHSAMELAFLIDFIYNSNKLEGSKLPREEVKKIIESINQENKTKKNNEVIYTLLTKNYLDQHSSFTPATLVKAHKLLLPNEPEKWGLRQKRILVGNDDSISDPKTIKDDLEKLFDWLKKNRTKLYPPELAFQFYYKFERIHPFSDGNGRLGRLLMNKVLKDNRYHPIILWDRRRLAHFNAFTKAAEGYLRALLEFMIEQYKETHTVYLKKIVEAKSLAEQIDMFLSPSL